MIRVILLVQKIPWYFYAIRSKYQCFSIVGIPSSEIRVGGACSSWWSALSVEVDYETAWMGGFTLKCVFSNVSVTD